MKADAKIAAQKAKEQKAKDKEYIKTLPRGERSAKRKELAAIAKARKDELNAAQNAEIAKQKAAVSAALLKAEDRKRIAVQKATLAAEAAKKEEKKKK
ncbi:MAG: hypothetical protein RR234_06080, partial [Christensenella sp.]